MSAEPELLCDPVEAERYLHDVEAGNLAYYSKRLISEAAAGSYNAEVKSCFMLAIGAVAIRIHEDYPYAARQAPYIDTARSTIERYYGLELIAATDPEMPWWQTHDEWDIAVRRAFARARFTRHGLRRPEFSATGCTIMLEHISNRRAYIRLPAR